MIKLRILILLFLFCIFHKCKILDAKYVGSPTGALKAQAIAKPAQEKHVVNKETKSSNVCLTPECKTAASRILKSIDPTVAPCDNFYKFACGNFIKTTVIPQNKTFVNSFDLVGDKIQKQLKIIIEEKIQPHEPRAFTLAKNFYKACMNTDEIEKNSIRAVLDDLKKLGGWPVLEGDSWNETKFDWKESIYKFKKLGYGSDYFFFFRVAIDYFNSTKRILEIDQTPLIVSREYMVKGLNNTIVRAYHDYMVDIAVILGANRTKAEKELKESLDFEIKLANISLSDDKRRNTTALNNLMTVKQLSQKYPSIPWNVYFNSILKPIIVIDDNEVIRVAVPTFFEKFEKLMKQTPKKVQANYLFWRGTDEDIDYTTDKIRNRKMKFSTVLYGQTERSARWKECLDMTSGVFGLSIGSLYIRKYFDRESKKVAEKLIADIKQQFLKILKEVNWMDEKTRKGALDKLDSMKKFVGYPDELLDNTILDEFYKKVEITPDDFIQAAANMSFFGADYFFGQLRKPVNKSDWTSHSATADVNAFYTEQDNSIQISAGILQDIFFNKNRLQSMNFAAIGEVIGHEMTHGFDIEGSQYDKNGDLVEWWQPQTKKIYLEKADCFIKQYGNYTVKEVGLKLNGINTQEENIADNGGVKEAYLAYQDWVKQNGPEAKLPGLKYSQEQIFWITTANMWCTTYKKETLKNDITTDTHSPKEFRVLGAFSNRPEFAKDFNCPAGSKMNPIKKCSLW